MITSAITQQSKTAESTKTAARTTRDQDAADDSRLAAEVKSAYLAEEREYFPEAANERALDRRAINPQNAVTLGAQVRWCTLQESVPNTPRICQYGAVGRRAPNVGSQANEP